MAIIGYLFYLEIFEIKFCGLNKNTKNKIYFRSINEVLDNDKIIVDDDEEDNEKIELTNNNDNNKNKK